MIARCRTVLIMAGGTGGHVFPAISIARQLCRVGAKIHWLGSAGGMEQRLLEAEPYPFHPIAVTALRGRGLGPLARAPSMLLRSLLQARRILRELRPDCLLGMGGYVTGPGALAGRLEGVPVMIHEQNAVPGLANRIVSRWAARIFEGFPNAFPPSSTVRFTGNPVRSEIVEVGRRRDYRPPATPLRLPVPGGSQGAQALNSLLPALFESWPGEQPLQVLHQGDEAGLAETRQAYQRLGIALGESCRVTGFIEEIGEAYCWADLVLCRAGASTVAEVAAAGLPAVFVPYPHHSDQQQLRNAQWLLARQAAEVIEQSELSPERLRETLARIDSDRDWLAEMSRRARDIAVTDAAERVAESCLEAIDG